MQRAQSPLADARKWATVEVMVALPNHRMSVDEYLAWAQGQPGRFELFDGVVYAMTPERAAHAEMKLAIHMAFIAGVRTVARHREPRTPRREGGQCNGDRGRRPT